LKFLTTYCMCSTFNFTRLYFKCFTLNFRRLYCKCSTLNFRRLYCTCSTLNFRRLHCRCSTFNFRHLYCKCSTLHFNKTRQAYYRLRNPFFWDMTPHHWVIDFRRFEVTQRFNLRGPRGPTYSINMHVFLRRSLYRV
jgi:hypothetical protein